MATEIAGLPATKGLPDGASPVDAVAVVQCVKADGSMDYYRLRTAGAGNVEAIGMHRSALVLYEAELAARAL